MRCSNYEPPRILAPPSRQRTDRTQSQTRATRNQALAERMDTERVGMIRFGLTRYTDRHFHGPLTDEEIREGDAREASRKARVIADLAAFDAQLRTLRREAKELHYTIDVSLVAPEAFKAQANDRLRTVMVTLRQLEKVRAETARRL